MTVTALPTGLRGAPTTVSPEPWDRHVTLRVVTYNSLALLVIVIASYQAEHASQARTQLNWLNVGIGAVILAGGINAIWMGRLYALIARCRHAVVERSAILQAPALRDAVGAYAGGLVTGPSMTRYHRPSCPLVDGKPVHSVSSGTADREKLSACGICRP